MRLPSAILSDADGTLVDTVKLIRHGQFEAVKTYLTQRERFLVRICPRMMFSRSSYMSISAEVLTIRFVVR